MQVGFIAVFFGFSLLCYPFFVARGSQMVKNDPIVEPLRRWASKHSAFLTELMGCLWCSSVWFGFGGFALIGLFCWLATFAEFYVAILPLAPIWALAMSEFTVFFERLFDRWLPDHMTGAEWSARYMSDVKVSQSVMNALKHKGQVVDGD